MEINERDLRENKAHTAVQRGRVAVQNITFIKRCCTYARTGAKWRRLPKEYGNRHVIYKRFNRRVKDGIIERLFRGLHANGIVETAQPVLFLGSVSVPVHPDACGALEKITPSFQ